MSESSTPRIEQSAENKIFHCTNCNYIPSDNIFDVIDTINTENDVISLCEECLELFWNSAKKEVAVDEVY